MTRFRPPERVESAQAQTRVLDRARRWAAATDPRVVRRLWPAQPDGAQRPLCLGCGAVLRDGALAAGAPGAPTPERPLEPEGLWCVVCLPCLEDYAGTRSARGLPERRHALVEAALRGD